MKERLRSLVVCLLVATLAVQPATAAVRIAPRGSSVDLLLLGFAVFQTNLSQQVEAFFDSSDQLPAEFTNRQVLSLRADGKVGKDVTVDARVSHDRENLRDWRWLVRVAGARNKIGLGELDGAFRDTQFTRFDTPFYGLEGQLGVGKLTASAFATSRKGNFRVDRLRGSNVSGPYILSVSPVLEGSDRVALEVRDRHDEDKLLRSDSKVRGRDYVIDYATGKITFTEPIEAETFEGNPVLVVVEYEFQAKSGAAVDYLGGGRLQVEPWKGVKLGSTYLRATSGAEPSLVPGVGIGAPSALARGGILGVDQSIAFGKWFSLDNEMAGPAGHLLDRDRGAWRTGLTLKPLAGLEVGARYRRVGAQFETVANPRLDSELDREELAFDTAFLAGSSHRLSAGYAVKHDNLAQDPARDRTRTRSLFAGWEGKMQGWPVLRLRLERRLSDGSSSYAGGVAKDDSVTLDAEQKLGRLPLFGVSTLKAEARVEAFDEPVMSAVDRRTRSFKLRLDSKPTEHLETYVEWRSGLTRGDGLTPLRSQSDEFLVGGRYRVSTTFQAGASLRLRTGSETTTGIGDSRRVTSIIDAHWEPSSRFKAILKYEWTLATTAPAIRTKSQNLFFQAAAVPFKGLTASVGYKLDDNSGDVTSAANNLDGAYFASVLYKHGERLTLFGRAERALSEERLAPFASTLSQRLTWILGGSVEVTSKWGILGEFRDERLTGAAPAMRRALVFEVSRSLARVLRLAVGVEFTVAEQGHNDRLDRERVYVKLIGKL